MRVFKERTTYITRVEGEEYGIEKVVRMELMILHMRNGMQERANDRVENAKDWRQVSELICGITGDYF